MGKKGIALLLTGSMLAGIFSGCQSEDVVEGKNETKENMEQETEQAEIWDGEEELTGELTIYSSIGCEVWDTYMIKKFESLHPGVHINFVTSEMRSGMNGISGWEAEISKITTEILSGDGADIIDCSQFPFYRYADSGILEDLNLYMEQDTDFRREDFYESVLDTMEYKGNLYAVPSSFTFFLLRVNKIAYDETVETDDGMLDLWDIAALWDTAVQEGALLEDSLYQKNTYGWLELMEDDIYIDYENGTNTVGAEEEKNLLEKLKAMYRGRREDYDTDKDKKVFVSNDPLLNFFVIRDDWMSDAEFLQETETATKPYVLKRTDGQLCIDAPEDHMWGINAGSQNKALAWEYIKFYIGEQEYTHGDYFEYPGTWVIPINRKNGEQLMEIRGATEEVKEWINSYANKISADYYNDILLTAYYWELMEQYYADEITVDEFMENYKDRVDIYLKE